MLDPVEAAAVAQQFGVSDEQVRRDHLLEDLLAVLARELPENLVFFGGTALARTHLPDGRLSEDLDLLAIPNRAEVVADLDRLLATGIRRAYGRLTWRQPLSSVRDVDPAVLRNDAGLAIRVQLLDSSDYPLWPTERRRLLKRYSDTPSATLIVPTLSAFAGSKTATWHDRHAPRDLYDLWGLAKIGAIDAAAASVFARYGPTGNAPRSWMFSRPPTDAEWTVQLGGQTRIAVGPFDALTAVRQAWTAAVATLEA